MVDRSVDGRRTGEVQWMSFVGVVVLGIYMTRGLVWRSMCLAPILSIIEAETTTGTVISKLFHHRTVCLLLSHHQHHQHQHRAGLPSNSAWATATEKLKMFFS